MCFANISSIFGNDDNDTLETDICHLENLVPDKEPDEVYFKFPSMSVTPVQVSTILNAVDPSEAIGWYRDEFFNIHALYNLKA